MIPGVDDEEETPESFLVARPTELPELPADLEDGGLELVEERWREMLRINPELLDLEFTRCPNQIAYLAAVHARATGDHLRAKQRTKQLFGLLRIQERERLVKSGVKKPTESQVDSYVEQQTLYQAAQLHEIDMEVAREEARGRMLAALAKKDMLVQMGANRRAELERDPVIRDRLNAARQGGAR